MQPMDPMNAMPLMAPKPPTDPSDPSNPSDPLIPSHPLIPSNPSNPSDPLIPPDPSTPSDPLIPTDSQAAQHPYVPFRAPDDGAIALEVFSTQEPVPPHRHRYQEFVLITRGSCLHRSGEADMPLIPGDVFLVPPHRVHAYVIETPVCMYNCQFYPERLPDGWSERFERMLADLAEPEKVILDAARSSSPASPSPASPASPSPADLNRQNIIHLSPDDAAQVQAWMERMRLEETERGYLFEQVKLDCLNLILVVIRRAQMRQFSDRFAIEDPRREIVAAAQRLIAAHYADGVDLSAFVRQRGMSAGYFRAVFKAETGLPPLEYLNRLRVVKAIELLKDESVPIGEIAAAVGIEDANWFSRLFRKVIGYSPRDFRSHMRRSAD